MSTIIVKRMVVTGIESRQPFFKSHEEAVLQYCLGFLFLMDKFKICCNHELVKCFVSILQYMHTGGKKS